MTTDRQEVDVAAKLTVDLLSVYLVHHTVEPEQLLWLARSLRKVFEREIGHDSIEHLMDSSGATESDGAKPQFDAGGALQPAVSIDQSVTDDYIVSLEDGRRFRSLKRHLMVKYGLTPEQYREKWGLPQDYPMVAPSYARERSEVARKSGLGLREASTPLRPRRGG